jgi:hypothetical protein
MGQAIQYLRVGQMHFDHQQMVANMSAAASKK